MADTTYPHLALLQGAQQAQGLPISKEVHFTETAGAGTYTGSVTVPAGAWIEDVMVQAGALWDAATSATLKVGDAADDDRYFTGVNLKATDLLAGESINFDRTGGKEGADLQGTATHWANRYSAAARVVSGVVTTVGASGSAGRTRLIVTYVVPSPSTAAAKA